MASGKIKNIFQKQSSSATLLAIATYNFLNAVMATGMRRPAKSPADTSKFHTVPPVAHSAGESRTPAGQPDSESESEIHCGTGGAAVLPLPVVLPDSNSESGSDV